MSVVVLIFVIIMDSHTLLVSIFLACAFLSCDANNFVCQDHNELEKSLEIYCDYYQKQLPRSCTHVNSSLNSLDIIRLKIEGCNQSDVCNYIESFKFVQQFDVSFSGFYFFNCSGIELKKLIEFNASYNELTAIPTKTLQKFQSLETLDLSQNYLTRIYNGDFKNFGRKVRQINLSHNNLAFIDDTVFVNFHHLEFINLNYNRFAILPTLNYLHSTRDVTIRENRLLSIIDCQFMLAMGLNRRVHLSWQYVKSFDGGKNCGVESKFRAFESSNAEGIYHSFGHLYHLFCNKNGFNNMESFVAGSQSFKNVRPMLKLLNPSVLRIDLSDNEVDVLDSNLFEQFKRLNELILSNISLMEFDFNVLNVNHQQHLVRLDISKNDLKSVENPMILQYFESLIDFNAAGNRIKNVDGIIRYLPMSIQRLNLADNHVNDINAVSRLVALEYLTLSNTNLFILDTSPFKPLRNLISLDISHNNLSIVDFANDFDTVEIENENISEIIPKLMSSMNMSEFKFDAIKPDESGIKLEIIQPDEPNKSDEINKSVELDRPLFQILKHLTLMNLSRSNLQQFDMKALNPLRKLHTLDISRNNLQWINLNVLSNLTQVERLYLNDNDLTALNNFEWASSPNISFAIERNNMPCAYLRQLFYENPNINFIDDPLNQKHGDDCRSSAQGISDFLSSVYEKVKLW